MSWRARWAALAVVLLPVFLISIDVTVLSISLPGISQDLYPSANELLWIVDSYSFVLACLLIVMGKFGDSFGRLRLLMWGSALFGAASVLSGFSTSPLMLIVGRSLQGLGGATLMPSTLGMIRHIFQKRSERRLALALWSAAFSSGSAIGPLLGGILLEVANWRYVFFINVPIVIVFVILAKLYVPESELEEAERIDLFSPVLLIASIFALVLSFKLLIDDFAIWQVGLLVAGAAGLALFWRRQYVVANPILDVDVVVLHHDWHAVLLPAIPHGCFGTFADRGGPLGTSDGCGDDSRRTHLPGLCAKVPVEPARGSRPFHVRYGLPFGAAARDRPLQPVLLLPVHVPHRSRYRVLGAAHERHDSVVGPGQGGRLRFGDFRNGVRAWRGAGHCGSWWRGDARLSPLPVLA